MANVIMKRPERVLMLNDTNGPVVMSAHKDCHGRYKWLAPVMLRFGRAHTFDTAEEALEAGAKQCGLKITEYVGPLK